jgi:hypothetical protein
MQQPCNNQVHPNSFLPKEWIMEKWEEGFYITSVAGSDSNNSLVVMSKGARFSQQSYKVRVSVCVCVCVCSAGVSPTSCKALVSRV